MRTRSFTYSTFQDLLDAAEFGPSSVPEEERASRGNNTDWYGTESFGQAMELARCGWPEGVSIIEDIAEKIGAVVSQQIVRPVPVYSVAGGFPDVARFLAGVPDCMLTFESQELTGPGKVIKVIASVGALSSVAPETIQHKGAAICALVDALESTGHRVELILDSSVNGKYSWQCTIKRADEPLEMDRIAFAFAHPSMLRRLIFSLREQAPNSVLRELTGKGGLGRSCNPLNTEGADIVLPSLRDNPREFASVASAARWVLGQLERQGVEVHR